VTASSSPPAVASSGPVAARILAELEALVRERVGDKRLAELKAALAELLALD
jgi:hypothetical protein